MAGEQQTFIFCGKQALPDLELKVREGLKSRITENPEYTAEEIKKVSSLESALFPKTFVLNSEDTDRLRLLSMLSQSGLGGLEKICSHRKVLGPVIVFAKRLFWRVLKGHLEGSFDAIQQFNSHMMCGHARQLVRLAELERALEKGGRSGTTG